MASYKLLDFHTWRNTLWRSFHIHLRSLEKGTRQGKRLFCSSTALLFQLLHIDPVGFHMTSVSRFFRLGQSKQCRSDFVFNTIVIKATPCRNFNLVAAVTAGQLCNFLNSAPKLHYCTSYRANARYIIPGLEHLDATEQAQALFLIAHFQPQNVDDGARESFLRLVVVWDSRDSSRGEPAPRL